MAGPLEGLKVLDFTTLLPGPYATMLLADMGAEILRIVSGTRSDLVYEMPPFIRDTGMSSAAAFLGRGKRSMNLNLKDPRSTRIIHQLLQEYDIIFEQFRPGVMGKLGLDYASLKKINPALIYCSLTGYGQTGPMTSRAGHDINYMSRSGLMSYSGRKEGGPTLTGMQIADVASGSNNSVIGILAAVISRNMTGKGQYVDISMTDGMLAFNILTSAGFLSNFEEPERESTFLNGGSLYDFYETKDKKHLSFGGLEPKFFTAFCEGIGRKDLISKGVMPPDIAKIKNEVRDIIKTKTRDEWTKIFEGLDACVEPVLTLGEALNDPMTKKREMLLELKMEDGSTVRQMAIPIKFSETKPGQSHAGLPAGVNTKEVLLGLGYSEEEIRNFEETDLFK